MIRIKKIFNNLITQIKMKKIIKIKKKKKIAKMIMKNNSNKLL